MAKKRKKDITTNKEKSKFLGKVQRHASYKDLKRQAVILGMPFPDVINASIGELSGYIAETNNTPDLTLIDKFDDYLEKHLIDIGYTRKDVMLDSRFRLGFIGEEDPETGEKKKKRVPGIKKERKPKRERDEHGFVKGTKKSFVIDRALQGMPLEKIVEEFVKAYPGSSEKSVKIWYRKGLKLK